MLACKATNKQTYYSSYNYNSSCYGCHHCYYHDYYDCYGYYYHTCKTDSHYLAMEDELRCALLLLQLLHNYYCSDYYH